MAYTEPQSDSFARFKIECGAYGHKTKVWLNDQEISQVLTDVSVHLAVNDAPRVCLTAIASDVEMKGLATVDVLLEYLPRRPSSLLPRIKRWIESNLISPNNLEA